MKREAHKSSYHVPNFHQKFLLTLMSKGRGYANEQNDLQQYEDKKERGRQVGVK